MARYQRTRPYDRPLEGLSSAGWDREHFRYGEDYDDHHYAMSDRMHDRAERAEQFRHTSLQYRTAVPGGERDVGIWDRVRGIFQGHGPRGYKRADGRIREDVCEILTDDPYVDASDVEVEVKDGEVTLTGTVSGRDVKRRAEALVDHVGGVRDVHNRLRIATPGVTATRPSNPNVS